jgi:hypothetical protein
MTNTKQSLKKIQYPAIFYKKNNARTKTLADFEDTAEIVDSV